MLTLRRRNELLNIGLPDGSGESAKTIPPSQDTVKKVFRDVSEILREAHKKQPCAGCSLGPVCHLPFVAPYFGHLWRGETEIAEEVLK